MADEIEAVTETAKASQEIAKTGQTAIEAVSGVAQFIANAMGTVPEDIVGLTFGDYLHELRNRNLDRVRRRTEKILRERGVEQAEPLRSKLAIPAFEAASEEGDELLQEIWARLLANAMDPNHPVHLQRVLIEALRQFEPVDVAVLRGAYMVKQNSKTRPSNISPNQVANELKLRSSLVSVSFDRLKDIGCLSQGEITNSAGVVDDYYWYIPALGKELLLACGPDATD